MLFVLRCSKNSTLFKLWMYISNQNKKWISQYIASALVWCLSGLSTTTKNFISAWSKFTGSMTMLGGKLTKPGIVVWLQRQKENGTEWNQWNRYIKCGVKCWRLESFEGQDRAWREYDTGWVWTKFTHSRKSGAGVSERFREQNRQSYLLGRGLLCGPCYQWAIGWKQDISAFVSRDKTGQETHSKRSSKNITWPKSQNQLSGMLMESCAEFVNHC